MASTEENRINDGAPAKEEGGVEKSPLYRKMTIVMHIVIFLYSAAFWIQVGVMPFLSKKLGANPVMFGYMETVFAVSMLVGGPLFGRFGDLVGSRAALIVAFVSSFLTYAVLAVADSIPYLFFSRVFGFMMHAMHGASMVMTDVSGTHERADALGKLGVSYGVGMVVGPTVGGYFTTVFSEQFSAGIASLLCVVAIVIVMATVPTTTKAASRLQTDDLKDKRETGSVFNIKAILSLLDIPIVRYIIILRIVVGIPTGVFHSMFTIVNMERFELTPESNGRLLSYIGILTMLMQGFVVGAISKRYSDSVIVRASIPAMALSYLLLTFANSIFYFAIVLVPMVMSGALLNTLASSIITKRVPQNATGTALGLNMAANSVIRTCAPTIGGYMYAWFGFPSFGLLGFVLNGALAVSVFTAAQQIEF